MRNSFAGFIITYNRVEVLATTITKIFEQTYPPAYLLIVDNSSNGDTENWYKQSGNTAIRYHKMGYNAGPAGAAIVGLQLLANDGVDWIYWGDDNDPPDRINAFELLFNCIQQQSLITPNIGIFGAIGGYFIKNRARTRNLYNYELKGNVPVDFVNGGKTMLVNALVVQKGILPSEKLFFGFEELDFCVKVKKAGFKIFVDGDTWLKGRQIVGEKLDPNYKWKGKSFGNKQLLWRNYYSSRNMLHILWKNKYYIGFIFFILRLIVKQFAAFKYGTKYGVQNFKIGWLALLHFFTGRSGRFEQIHQH